MKYTKHSKKYLSLVQNNTMNYFTQLSIDYANQRSYLDDLFHVYPTIAEGIREIQVLLISFLNII